MTPKQESDRKRHWQHRLDAIAAYGGHCEICGIANPQYLTIDHIDNNGAEHRRKMMGGNIGGWNFYAKLKKEGYPPGYRVLCWNHNAARQTHPYYWDMPYTFVNI